MTVNDSRLWKGTLTFGDVGTPEAVASQVTNVVIEQQDGDSEDTVNVLSGETVGGETNAGPWHITATLIQDFAAANGFQRWSYVNRNTKVPFTFTPNDSANAPTITGTVNAKFVGIGGDVKTRITRDIDWGIDGEPDFGDWGTAEPAGFAAFSSGKTTDVGDVDPETGEPV
jgi:hypothetical protein